MLVAYIYFFLKVDVPHSITYLNYTLIFEYMVWCGSKKWSQKDVCLWEIKLHIHNLMIFMSPIVNIIEKDLFDHLMNTRIVTLIMNKIVS